MNVTRDQRWDPSAVRARAEEAIGLCDAVERAEGEVSTMKALCHEAADSLAGALECIREEVPGGLDEEDERAQMDLIRRLREAGGGS